MTDTTDTKALSDRLRSLAKTATPGKWWIDSHGEALVAFTDEGIETVLKPEHLREKAHRDENTGGLSYWPNDSDASWIAAAQPQNIIALLDQLEAERQRAAGSEEELHKALHREKAAEREEVERLREDLLVERNAAINLSNHLSDCAGKLRAANAEIAALKGDQVPVGFAVMDENHDWHIDFCGKEHALSHGDSLFTAPQKLIVRPRLEPCLKQVQFERDCEWIEAIEAAGGIVKDGE